MFVAVGFTCALDVETAIVCDANDNIAMHVLQSGQPDPRFLWAHFVASVKWTC